MEEWKKYRDESAQELKSTPDIDRRKGKLEEIQATTLYKVSRFIKQFKSEFPDIYQKAEIYYGTNCSSIESSEEWDVSDVSDKIPAVLKMYFELMMVAELLTEEHYNNSTFLEGFDIYGEAKKILEYVHLSNPHDSTEVSQTGFQDDIEKDPIHILTNDLTNGEYFNLRNFNHVMSGARTSSTEKLDIDSNIQLSHQTHVMWFERGANPWLSGRTLLIMTPYSKGGREFIKRTVQKQSYYDEISKTNKQYDVWPKDSQYYLADLPLKNEDKANGINLHFDSREIGLSWSDVFDIIVDLRIGKIYKKKINDADRKNIIEEVEQYRKKFYLKSSNN